MAEKSVFYGTVEAGFFILILGREKKYKKPDSIKNPIFRTNVCMYFTCIYFV